MQLKIAAFTRNFELYGSPQVILPRSQIKENPSLCSEGFFIWQERRKFICARDCQIKKLRSRASVICGFLFQNGVQRITDR